MLKSVMVCRLLHSITVVKKVTFPLTFMCPYISETFDIPEDCEIKFNIPILIRTL